MDSEARAAGRGQRTRGGAGGGRSLMRWLSSLLLTAFGWGLAAVGAWGWRGWPGWPGAAQQLGPQARAAAPVVALVLFGLYLAAVLGEESPRWLLALQAALALAIVGTPLLYTFGLAARYGLPPQAGGVGSLLAGHVVRTAAAVWLALATARLARGRAPAPRPTLDLPQAPPPAFWAPAPFIERPVPSGEDTGSSSLPGRPGGARAGGHPGGDPPAAAP